jgi:hypothetical protein
MKFAKFVLGVHKSATNIAVICLSSSLIDKECNNLDLENVP